MSIQSDQFPLLLSLIEQKNNLYVIGPQGIGKTYSVIMALKLSQIPFQRINHLYCASKDTLLINICKALAHLWELNIKPVKKFSQLSLTLSEITQNDDGKNKFGYIILDMPKLPDFDFKHFHRVFGLSNYCSKSYGFKILIVCNELHDQFSLPQAPILILRPFTEQQMIKIITQDLRAQIEENNIFHFLETIQEQFSRDIVSTFSICTSNLNILLKLARGLYEHYVTPTIPFIQKQKQPGFKQSIEYIEAKKLLLENPFQQINAALFKDQVEQNCSKTVKKDKLDKLDQFNKAQNKQAAQTLGELTNKIQLQKIPGFILLASYYASKNPERTDRNIFKDYYKSKNKIKAKTRIHEFATKRPNIHRLIAITQVLIGIVDQQDLKVEQNMFDQSTLFYEQIQHLVQLGYLERIQKKDNELSKVKFDCKITEKQAYDLAQDLGIKFYEYLKNQQ